MVKEEVSKHFVQQMGLKSATCFTITLGVAWNHQKKPCGFPVYNTSLYPIMQSRNRKEHVFHLYHFSIAEWQLPVFFPHAFLEWSKAVLKTLLVEVAVHMGQ